MAAIIAQKPDNWFNVFTDEKHKLQSQQNAETPTKSLLLQKAREIQQQTEKFVEYLEEQGLEEPNSSTSSLPHPTTQEYDALRIKITQAAEDLILLTKSQ